MHVFLAFSIGFHALIPSPHCAWQNIRNCGRHAFKRRGHFFRFLELHITHPG